MVTPGEIRELALALPEVVEQDHHGRPSFRVGGKIFATLWEAERMNVMLDEPGIHTAVQENPGGCAEFWWGRRLRAVQVDLTRTGLVVAGGLLVDGWEQKAPKRLLANRSTALSGRALELTEQFGLSEDDVRAWQQTGLPEVAFDPWLTDRVARRPAGRRARQVYGAPDIHDFARRDILAALALKPGERLLDVGCGGGLLLRDALDCGASATGLDHSPEMVSLARERAHGAEVVLASAERLPFADGSFNAVAMSVMFFLLPNPAAALAECRRVLASGGRIAIYTTAPRLRGTPAAPEPLASQSYFYENDELLALAREAGFVEAAVRDEDGGQLLTAKR